MPHELMHLWRSARGCCLAIVALALLLLLGACVALGWGVTKWTEAAGEPGLDVMLVIDQSGSLWELGGVGTDPELLRMEGARLFAATLGVDGAAAGYRLGAVYFGTQPTLLAPLTPLTGPGNDRSGLLVALSGDPQPMGWTDVNAALALAYDELFLNPRAQAETAKAVVLFTDGRPQTEALDSTAALATYVDALRTQIQAFTAQGAIVHTVLLGNAASDADPLTAELYRPLWVSLAQQDSSVQFYEARASQDLTLIYHDIVTRLQRTESQGLVLRNVVNDRLEARATVQDGWQSATFVITKSRPDLQVTLAGPDGQTMRADAAGVRHTSQLDGRYETWSIHRPADGEWRVQVTGQGAVTVWLDYQPLPATATPTASPTATRTPTATPSPAASPTVSASPTATATVSPTATPLAQVTVTVANRRVAWPWLAGVGVATGLGVAGGARRWQRRQPQVEGVLRLVQGPAGQPTGVRWDLSQRRRRAVTLGSNSRCEVALLHDPGLPAQAAIIAANVRGPQLSDVSGSQVVRINGKSVAGPVALRDGDRIDVGGYQLRYENLALRRRSPQGATGNQSSELELVWPE